MSLQIRKLESGYFHIRGLGPCNWAQPKHWPCDEETLRKSAFPQASEEFIREALREAGTPSERPQEPGT